MAELAEILLKWSANHWVRGKVQETHGIPTIVIGAMFNNLAIERGPTNCGNYLDFMGNHFSLAQFWDGVESPIFFIDRGWFLCCEKSPHWPICRRFGPSCPVAICSNRIFLATDMGIWLARFFGIEKLDTGHSNRLPCAYGFAKHLE
jgi:hypothetical protein